MFAELAGASEQSPFRGPARRPATSRPSAPGGASAAPWTSTEAVAARGDPAADGQALPTDLRPWRTGWASRSTGSCGCGSACASRATSAPTPRPRRTTARCGRCAFGEGPLDLEATGTRTRTSSYVLVGLGVLVAIVALMALLVRLAGRVTGADGATLATMTAMRSTTSSGSRPGPGMWFPSVEHLPTPMCGLLSELLPRAAEGWAGGVGALRPRRPTAAAFGIANCWGFYSPGTPGRSRRRRARRVRGRDARRTGRGAPGWREWRDVRRPAVVAANRALLSRRPRRARRRGAGRPRAGDHRPLRRARPAALRVGERRRRPRSARCCRRPRTWGLDPGRCSAALAGASAASLVRRAAVRPDRRTGCGRRCTTSGRPRRDPRGRRRRGRRARRAALDYGWRVFDVDLLEPDPGRAPGGRPHRHPGRAGAGWGAPAASGRRRPRRPCEPRCPRPTAPASTSSPRTPAGATATTTTTAVRAVLAAARASCGGPCSRSGAAWWSAGRGRGGRRPVRGHEPGAGRAAARAAGPSADGARRAGRVPARRWPTVARRRCSASRCRPARR